MDHSEDSTVRGRHMLFQHSKKRAFDCLNKNEFSRAFAHLIVALTIEPDDEGILNMFLYTLGMLSNELEVQENWNDLLICYQKTLELLPHNSQVLHGLATVLFRLGHIESATKYFQKAYKENPFYTPSLYCIDNIKNALVERWHFMMLNDKNRNSAFSEAINRAVCGGYKCVLDIGAGTGILSMMAVDAGAESVYACEGSQVMFGILQSVIEANKKKIHLLDQFSFDIVVPDDLPNRVNLVVTETFDAGLFGEHVLQTLSHAWDHLLALNTRKDKSCVNAVSNSSSSTDNYSSSSEPRQAKVIPQSAVLWAVPIECGRVRKHLRVEDRLLEIMNLSNLSLSASFCDGEPYTTERLSDLYGGYTLLCAPKSVLMVDFNDAQEIKSLLSGKSFCAEYDCINKGQMDAVALWFDLNLDDCAKLSTAPENRSSCWEQAIFYVFPQLLQGTSPFVNVGDSVTVEFLCKGHLALQRVVTSVMCNLPKSVPMDSAVIQAMNSLFADGVLSLNLTSEAALQKNPLVVDVSTVPLIGLKALKDGAEKLVILPTKYLRSITELQQLCSIARDRIRMMSYEDICIESLSCGLLITEPVDMNGLLKKNIFEDIALMRNMCLMQPPTVYPKQLGIFAKLIESPILYQQAKIISDDNCMGYKISQFLNIYQCNIYQDVQLSTLAHETLCDAVKLCDIDLNELLLERNKLQSFVEFHGSVNVRITRNGKISAIPYWFSLVYNADTIVDTSFPNSLWKQAAIIPENEITVCEGDNVSIVWTCRNSCLNILVKKV